MSGTRVVSLLDSGAQERMLRRVLPKGWEHGPVTVARAFEPGRLLGAPVLVVDVAMLVRENFDRLCELLGSSTDRRVIVWSALTSENATRIRQLVRHVHVEVVLARVEDAEDRFNCLMRIAAHRSTTVALLLSEIVAELGRLKAESVATVLRVFDHTGNRRRIAQCLVKGEVSRPTLHRHLTAAGIRGLASLIDAVEVCRDRDARSSGNARGSSSLSQASSEAGRLRSETLYKQCRRLLEMAPTDAFNLECSMLARLLAQTVRLGA